MKIWLIPVVMLVLLAGGPDVQASQPEARYGDTQDECMECHEASAADHLASVHQDVQCAACHPQAVEEDHWDLHPTDCRQCHAPHDETVAHDAHIGVSCKACHQKNGVPAVDPESGGVVFSGRMTPGKPFQPHRLTAESGDSLCRRCHFQGNRLGAAAMILPAKSVLCMPCHAATFSIGDRTTLFALAVFLLGMIGVGGLWFSADAAPESHSRGVGGFRRFATQVVAEVLFLRRLFRLSPARWAIHGLMFYPILLRLMFGLSALLLSLTLPNAGLTRVLLNKNGAFAGLFFDITGLMIIAGVGAAVLRSPEDRQPVPGTPAPGRFMTLLLGCIILAGFILEGMRIAMTGWPAGAGWAFVGYGLSLLMAGMEKLTDAYGYLWYIHAILTGAFIALIPFTRMLHIITAPLSLMVEIQSHREDKG